MAKTGIHFVRCKANSVEAHNERTQDYLKSVQKSGRHLYFFEDKTHLNKSWVNGKYHGMTCSDIFERQKQRYRDIIHQEPNLKDSIITSKKTGKQRIVCGWNPLREGVAPIKENTKLEDFEKFIAWCNQNGLNVVRIDLHFDEGYEEETGKRKYNHHAHIIVDWMDWDTGKTTKLDASKMSEVQDVIAASLDMERGEKKLESGKEHLAPAQFKEKRAEEHLLLLLRENEKLKKENDTLQSTNTGLKAKIQDTWQFKSRAEAAESALESKEKAYKEEIKALKETLAEVKNEAEKAEKAISYYRSENNKLQKELQKESVRANRWERMYNDLIHPDDPKKRISR